AEGDRAGGARARVLRGRGQREEAAQHNRRRGEVAEPRLAQEVDRPGAEVSGDEERSDQVPRAVEALAPAEGAADELGGGRDAIEQESNAPDQLERVAALPPLVEHERRKEKAHDRRGERKHDVEGAQSRSTIGSEGRRGSQARAPGPAPRTSPTAAAGTRSARPRSVTARR